VEAKSMENESGWKMWKKSQTSEFQKEKSRKYTKTKKLNIKTCLYKGSQVQGSVNHLEADQKNTP